MINETFLAPDFVAQYTARPPDFGPLGAVTYYRTYARSGEHFHDTVARVVNGVHSWMKYHCVTNNRPWEQSKAEHSARQMFQAIWSMRWLPPGRGLWSMGTSTLFSSGAAANNCGFTATGPDFSSSVEWLMNMLMLGVGVGFDTSAAGISIFPPVPTESVYTIPDTREGWASSTHDLLLAYCKPGGSVPSFNYDAIRSAGQPIKGFGGTASGPGPLKELHAAIKAILEKRAGYTLVSSDVVDICNLVGRCVVAGNVRRSAEIALAPYSDKSFLDLKNKSLWPEQVANHRWASNNSVIVDPTETDYGPIAERIISNGEPGVLWLRNSQAYSRMGRRPDWKDRKVRGTNPCAEQPLEDRELCCLVECFPSRHKTYYEFQQTLKYAYLYAKIVSLIPTHDDQTNEVIKRNRRIGCSLSGIQHSIAQLGLPEFTRWCNSGYKYINALDQRYSEWLDVARSIKTTSVKPSGTVSKLPGVSSGIHFDPAPYWMQVIRVSSDSKYAELHRASEYKVVDLPNEPNTSAIYFPMASGSAQTEQTVSAWEQFEYAAKLQHYWADNQVSVTIKFSPAERDHVEPILQAGADRLKSISFLPNSTHGYEHAPMQPCSADEYHKYKASLRPVNYGEATHEAEEKFCDGETCTI